MHARFYARSLATLNQAYFLFRTDQSYSPYAWQTSCTIGNPNSRACHNVTHKKIETYEDLVDALTVIKNPLDQAVLLVKFQNIIPKQAGDLAVCTFSANSISSRKDTWSGLYEMAQQVVSSHTKHLYQQPVSKVSTNKH